ncbi:hypothetical protein DFH08DRAFT_804162 [Mycena albidolilacea]|uniref:Novel STAND NTPase 1 domain-containing protein n=1 Tax=Mycena albidolilacea TaxID=1033008 RepID=A0AAD7ABE9_9AGAR|nr:hypothetical protein DFH08DRAFT_804162 [Mycena albidolilacea]
MPHRPMVTEVRINNIITSFRLATTVVANLNANAFGTSYLQAISHTTLALVTALENVKSNKLECIQLLEDAHGVIYAIINLHLKSDPPGNFPVSMLGHIAKFTETTQKIHTYLEAQQDGNIIKKFFRQSELKNLLVDCGAGLRDAKEVFKASFFMESGTSALADVAEMQKMADDMNQELLEMISNLSDASSSDETSFIYRSMNSSQMRYQTVLGNEHALMTGLFSSKSFSMLPSKPKIFHGRKLELDAIVKMLNKESARIAILGAGGMGKTSLARAALHHTEVAEKYKQCVFVPCDSVATDVGIAALIGEHIGLKSGKDMTQPVLRYFTTHSTCLLILDNLETAWEPLGSRAGAEELLSLLSEISHLALMITMRGAERPSKIRWSQPFLQPLQPLSDDAARQTIFDIAEDFHEPKDLEQILNLTQNMPLAVDLFAHLVDHEGCSSVLARWEQEKTSLLSVGHDRGSNLDASIEISISSPRITSSPGAMDLLRLLSILPDGLSDNDLLQSSLPIPDILACKAVLLGTSLAYKDEKKRLKSLVLIREHVQKFHAPPLSLIQPLQKYFNVHLDLYRKYFGSPQMVNAVTQINSNFGNLNQILVRGLHITNPDAADTIECTLSLAIFTRVSGRGRLSLVDYIPAALPKPTDHRLEALLIVEILSSDEMKKIKNPDTLVSQAMAHLAHFNDPVVETRFYRALAHHHYAQNEYSEAIALLEKALALATSSGVTIQQMEIMRTLAGMKLRLGEITIAKTLAADTQKLAKVSGNLYRAAEALEVEASCFNSLGDFRQSVLLLHRASELIALCGMSGCDLDRRILGAEAEIYLLKSEYAEARQIQNQIAQDSASEYIMAFALVNIAQIDVASGGNEHDVNQKLQYAKQQFSNGNRVMELTYCEITLASLKLREGDALAARSTLTKHLQHFEMETIETVFGCLEYMSDFGCWDACYLEETLTWSVIHLAYAKKCSARLQTCKALQFLGKVFLANTDTLTAESLFIVALNGFTYMDIHRSRAGCMLHLGDIAMNQGQPSRASEFWNEARPLFERSLQAKNVSEIDQRLSELEKHEGNLQHLAQLNVPMVPLQEFPISQESKNMENAREV